MATDASNEEVSAHQPDVYCNFDAMVDCDKLVLHDRNPNTHCDEQLRLYANAILSNGWRRAVCVSNRSGKVIRGNGAVLACREYGIESVPVEYQDYDSEEAENADMIADNELSRLSVRDENVLGELLNELPEDMMSGVGLPEDDMAELLKDFNDGFGDGSGSGDGEGSNERPESLADHRLDWCKKFVADNGIEEGCVFRSPCGRFLLFCGDSANIVGTDAFYERGVPHAMITDPEYLCNGRTGRTELWKDGTELYQDWDREGLQGTLSSVIGGVRLQDGWTILAFCGWRGVELMLPSLEARGKRRNLIVVRKGIGMGDRFRNAHELVWYFTDGENEPVFNGGHDTPNVIDFVFPKKRFAHERTPKPVGLLEQLIELVTDEGQHVADPFCGTSPMMEAALSLDRTIVSCDINPIMFAASVLRYCEFDGIDPADGAGYVSKQ